MVKGISKRAIVVRPNDSNIFDEAIFIVSNDNTCEEDVLKEACKIAEKYISPNSTHLSIGKIHLLTSALVGAMIVGIIWASSYLIF